MLFETPRHEPLTNTVWNAEKARATLQAIAHETDHAFNADHFWKNHPYDSESTGEVQMTSLFNGASAIIWGLLHLQEQKAISSLSRNYAEKMEAVYQAYLKNPDSDTKAPGYLFGEAGILTVHERFKPGTSYQQRLLEAIAETIPRPENELMWAAPGTLIAAKLLYDRTHEQKYLELILKTADHLIAEWKFVPALGLHIWTQDLYGTQRILLGGVHGFAGNVLPLLKVLKHLTIEQQNFILDKSAETLIKTSMTEKGLANWKPTLESDKAPVQWCHGSPGIITSFADYPVGRSLELDQLLLQAGELIWVAGPLTKPFGLCHGTAGNGYAFLKLYHRTRDPQWLERARAFAMHAIEQSDACLAKYGHRRYELLTGDMGLAMYLWSCLEENSAWPLMDVL